MEAFNLFLGSHIVRTYHCLPECSYEVPEYKSVQHEVLTHHDVLANAPVTTVGIQPSMMHAAFDDQNQYFNSSPPGSPDSVGSLGSLDPVSGLNLPSYSASSESTSVQMDEEASSSGISVSYFERIFEMPDPLQGEVQMHSVIGSSADTTVYQHDENVTPIASLCLDGNGRTRCIDSKNDIVKDVFMVSVFDKKEFGFTLRRCAYKGCGFKKLFFSDSSRSYTVPWFHSKAVKPVIQSHVDDPLFKQNSIETLTMALDVCHSYFIACYETAQADYAALGKPLPRSIANCKCLFDLSEVLEQSRGVFNDTNFYYSWKRLNIFKFLTHTRKLVRQIRRFWGDVVFSKLPMHVSLSNVSM
jgi:hypothetical protein